MQSKAEWRCARCGKLLGMLKGGRLHLRFARCHEYLVGFPATGTCRWCGTLNQCPWGPNAETLGAAVER